jgi:hypothetical protein
LSKSSATFSLCLDDHLKFEGIRWKQSANPHRLR